MVSDAHPGIKAARKAVTPNVAWQRCQFHLQQNAQSYVTKRSLKSEVAGDIRAIFNAASQDDAKRICWALPKVDAKAQSVGLE